MNGTIVFASLALVAAPAAAEPALVANSDGSVTLTLPIESAPAPLLQERTPRPSRKAAHVRARAQAEAELDRAFTEATSQTRDAARVPRPH